MRGRNGFAKLFLGLWLTLLGFTCLALAALVSADQVGKGSDPGLRTLVIVAGLAGFVFLCREAVRLWWPDDPPLLAETDHESPEGSRSRP